MRYVAAAAALAALVGCGDGGAKPGAAPTTPATTESAAIHVEAKVVRDAVAATLAECPCEVSVEVGSFLGATAPYSARLRGIYDPATQSAVLNEVTGAAATGIVFRIVQGRTFLDPGLGKWVELDYSGVPAKPVSALYPTAMADPRIAFAIATNVTSAAATTASVYDTETDMAAAVPAAGPSGDLLKRLVPGPSLYGHATIENGRMTLLRLDTTDIAGGVGATIHLTMRVEATRRTAPNVAVPAVERTVDVATEEIAS